MARREPLIAHVDPELALKIKMAADAAGVTASAFMGEALEQRMDNGSISATYFRDIQPGMKIVVDPIMGIEDVVRFTQREMEKTGIKVMHIELSGPRFIVRAASEPCLIVH